MPALFSFFFFFKENSELNSEISEITNLLIIEKCVFKSFFVCISLKNEHYNVLGKLSTYSCKWHTLTILWPNKEKVLRFNKIKL